MICQNPKCGRELIGTMLVCRSNQPPDGTCKESRCPGLRFCSSQCVSDCWRAHNAFPQVIYIVQPVMDELEAAREAKRIIETARLSRLWRPSTDGEQAA